MTPPYDAEPGSCTLLPFEPEQVAPAAARAANLMLGRALAGELEGLRLEGRFTWAEPVQGVRLEWLAGGEAASLLLPTGPLRQLLRQLGAPDLLETDPAAACLLLELALAPVLDRAEAALGSTLSLARIEHGAGPGSGIGIAATLDGAPFGATLRAGPALLAALSAAARALPPPAAGPAPPLVLAWRAGVTSLPTSALAALAPGDAIVFDACALDRAEVALVAGEHLAAPVRLAPGGAVLAGPLREARGTRWEGWTMTDDAAIPDLPEGELRLTLVFELGRRTATLDEVRSMQPGCVLPLHRDAAGPVDILANGARLGRGEIVRVGEAWAVRIVHLSGQG